MLLLTPVRSEVCHVKTPLFLSKNESSSISSSSDTSLEIIIVLSGILGSSRTFLVLHSGSMAGSLVMPFSRLVAFRLWLLLTLSFCRQFTFRWPGAKPYSIFLTSL
jgi:hypothetical protein